MCICGFSGSGRGGGTILTSGWLGEHVRAPGAPLLPPPMNRCKPCMNNDYQLCMDWGIHAHLHPLPGLRKTVVHKNHNNAQLAFYTSIIVSIYTCISAQETQTSNGYTVCMGTVHYSIHKTSYIQKLMVPFLTAGHICCSVPAVHFWECYIIHLLYVCVYTLNNGCIN
jgi:hypothetical protein